MTMKEGQVHMKTPQQAATTEPIIQTPHCYTSKSPATKLDELLLIIFYFFSKATSYI